MDLLIKQWVTESATDNIASCYFCSNIAVVYSGIKPAEIINISADKLQQCLLLKDHIRFIVLSKRNNLYKLFVYHPKKLEETLNKKVVMNYLIKLGYSETFHLEEYIKTLVMKLRKSDCFPHEIGFFLGYPVKDVLSFMGLIDLPFIKTMGWRMYGNTNLSEQLYRQVRDAKEEIVHYAKQSQKHVS